MDGDARLVRVFARSTRTPAETLVAVRIAMKNRNAPASRPCGDGSVTHRVPASRKAVIETTVMPLTKTQPARRWVTPPFFVTSGTSMASRAAEPPAMCRYSSEVNMQT